MQPTSKNTNLAESEVFEVKDSLTVLLIVFAVAVLFAVLLCYYPGKAFLGGNFWPLFALPALLAAGCLIKILSRKTILKVDADGLRFFRSGIIVSWQQLQSADLTEEDEGDGQLATYLKIKYIDSSTSKLLETNFPIVGSMDKTAVEIMEAIAHFHRVFTGAVNPPTQAL